MERASVVCILPDFWPTNTLPFSREAFAAELYACPEASVTVISLAEMSAPTTPAATADLVIWLPPFDERRESVDRFTAIYRIRQTYPGSRLAAWVVDDPHNFDQTYGLAPEVDLLFTNDPNAELACHTSHVSLLPPATCRTEKDNGTELEFEVAFLKMASATDTSLFLDIVEALPSTTRLLLVGEKEDPFPEGVILEPDRGEEGRLRQARRAKIVLRSTARRKENSNEIHRLSPVMPDLLTLAIAEAGVPVLSPLRHPSFFDLLTEGTEAICFSDLAEGIGHLKRLLTEETERRSLANAARERIHREHLYRHRLSMLVKQVRFQ